MEKITSCDTGEVQCGVAINEHVVSSVEDVPFDRRYKWVIGESPKLKRRQVKRGKGRDALVNVQRKGSRLTYVKCATPDELIGKYTIAHWVASVKEAIALAPILVGKKVIIMPRGKPTKIVSVNGDWINLDLRDVDCIFQVKKHNGGKITVSRYSASSHCVMTYTFDDASAVYAFAAHIRTAYAEFGGDAKDGKFMALASRYTGKVERVVAPVVYTSRFRRMVDSITVPTFSNAYCLDFDCQSPQYDPINSPRNTREDEHDVHPATPPRIILT